jgi:hypothetical protein
MVVSVVEDREQLLKRAHVVGDRKKRPLERPYVFGDKKRSSI